MHLLEIAFRRLRQDGTDDLCHITKLLESDAHLMHAGRILDAHFRVGLHHPRVGVVHRMQQPGREYLPVRLFLECTPDLNDALLYVRWPGGPNLFARDAQQARFTLLQMILKQA